MFHFQYNCAFFPVSNLTKALGFLFFHVFWNISFLEYPFLDFTVVNGRDLFFWFFFFFKWDPYSWIQHQEPGDEVQGDVRLAGDGVAHDKGVVEVDAVEVVVVGW